MWEARVGLSAGTELWLIVLALGSTHVVATGKTEQVSGTWERHHGAKEDTNKPSAVSIPDSGADSESIFLGTSLGSETEVKMFFVLPKE